MTSMSGTGVGTTSDDGDESEGRTAFPSRSFRGALTSIFGSKASVTSGGASGEGGGGGGGGLRRPRATTTSLGESDDGGSETEGSAGAGRDSRLPSFRGRSRRSTIAAGPPAPDTLWFSKPVNCPGARAHAPRSLRTP